MGQRKRMTHQVSEKTPWKTLTTSAPCSLFSVAAWVNDQLDMTNTGFVLAIDTLVSSGAIEVSADDSGLIVDLV